MELTHEQETQLIKALFRTPDGKKLLAHWMDMYVLNNTFHENSNVMYARLGQQDFVTNIAVALSEEDHD